MKEVMVQEIIKKYTFKYFKWGISRYSKKKDLNIKFNMNNTLTSSDNNSTLVKKSNLKQSSNKMLFNININDNENEYSNIKYNLRKKRKTKRSSSNITAHGSNFLQNKLKLNLNHSNKDSNSLSDENNSKQSGKLYSLENNLEILL